MTAGLEGGVESSGVARKDANLCVATDAVAETAGAPVDEEPNTGVDEAVLVGLKNGGALDSAGVGAGLDAPNGVVDPNENGLDEFDEAPKPAKPVNL